MLKIDHLSASYKTLDGNIHVVKNVDFEIFDNEIFGIAHRMTLHELNDLLFDKGAETLI